MFQGIKLIGDFIGRAHGEEQRQALLQEVEYYRSIVKDNTKASLALL